MRPSAGSLFLNKRNSKKINYTNIFGLLTQESFILNDSFDKNVTLSEKKEKKIDIIDAINLANLDDFYNKKTRKFVKRTSINFSEGEKQRIGISNFK